MNSVPVAVIDPIIATTGQFIAYIFHLHWIRRRLTAENISNLQNP